MLTCAYAFDAEPIPTKQLLAHLAEQRQSIVRRRVGFEVAAYSGSGDLPDTPLPDQLSRRREIVFCFADPIRYRLDEVVSDAGDVLYGLVGRRMRQTFDGVERRVVVWQPGTTIPRCRIHPLDTVTDEPFQSWLGWWIAQYPVKLGYLELVSMAADSPRLLDTGETEWIIRPRSAEPHVFTFRAERHGGNPRITETVAEFYGGDDESPHVAARIRTKFLYSDERVVPLATRAIVSTQLKDTNIASWEISEIELLTIEEARVDDAAFVAEFPAGAAVSDARLGLFFHVGDSTIFFNGQPFETGVPLDATTSTRLPELMRGGHWTAILPVDETPSPTNRWPIRFGLCLSVLALLIIARRRMTRPSVVAALLLLMTPAIVAGCSEPVSVANQAAGSSVHLGRIDIDDGPRVVTHEFNVENASDEALRIVQVKPSCGCVTATVSDQDIAPFGAVALTVSVEIDRVGPISQGASVLFSDGHVEDYVVGAIGIASRVMSLIPRSAGIETDSGEFRAMAYVVGGGQDKPRLAVASPAGVKLRVTRWTTLDAGDRVAGRPHRSLTEFVLDFARYEGDLPARFEVRLGQTTANSLFVYPEDLSKLNYFY